MPRSYSPGSTVPGSFLEGMLDHIDARRCVSIGAAIVAMYLVYIYMFKTDARANSGVPVRRARGRQDETAPAALPTRARAPSSDVASSVSAANASATSVAAAPASPSVSVTPLRARLARAHSHFLSCMRLLYPSSYPLRPVAYARPVSSPRAQPPGLSLALTPLLARAPSAPPAAAVACTAAAAKGAGARVQPRWYSVPAGGPVRVTVTLDLSAAVGDVPVFDTAADSVCVRALPMSELLTDLVEHTRVAEARVAAATSAHATRTRTAASSAEAGSAAAGATAATAPHPAWIDAIAATSFLLAMGTDVHVVCHVSSEAEETAVTVLFYHAGLLTHPLDRSPADVVAAEAYFGSRDLSQTVAQVVALAPRPLPRQRMLFCSTETGRRALVRALVPGIAIEPPPTAIARAASSAGTSAGGSAAGDAILTTETASQLLDGLAHVSHVHVCDRAYEIGGATLSDASAAGTASLSVAPAAIAPCDDLPRASRAEAEAARTYVEGLARTACVGGEGHTERGRVFWSPNLLGYLEDAP